MAVGLLPARLHGHLFHNTLLPACSAPRRTHHGVLLLADAQGAHRHRGEDDNAHSSSRGVGMMPLNRGKVVAVSCCNLDGYDLGCGSRVAASDGLDLGRAFPGALQLCIGSAFHSGEFY